MAISHNPLSDRGAAASEPPISYLMQHALANPNIVSLAAGFVDQRTLPVDICREAIGRILSEPESGCEALQYGTTKGHPPLRELVLARLAEADRAAGQALQQADASDVLISAGSNQLLHLISDCLLNPGDIVICAAPSYFVYLGLLQNLNVRAVGVPTDDQGIDVAALDATLSRLNDRGELPRVKMVYLVTYFDNPHGTTLARDRRPAVLDVVEKWSKNQHIYVIEDAAYRELRYDGDDIPSLRSYDPTGDRVAYLSTFSKSFSPGIRVGWGLVPDALIEPLAAIKGNWDFGSPHFSQRLMMTVLELGLYEPHVDLLRRNYAVKLDAMVSALREHLSDVPGVRWYEPQGGLYIWMTVPERIDTSLYSDLFIQALNEEMLYVPGVFCYPGEPAEPPRNTIRLSFGVQSPEKIRDGVAALGRAIRALT